MSLETTVTGIAGIILGIGIYIKTGVIVPASIPIILGIAIILFSKEEKIEERKDKQ